MTIPLPVSLFPQYSIKIYEKQTGHNLVLKSNHFNTAETRLVNNNFLNNAKQSLSHDLILLSCLNIYKSMTFSYMDLCTDKLVFTLRYQFGKLCTACFLHTDRINTHYRWGTLWFLNILFFFLISCKTLYSFFWMNLLLYDRGVTKDHTKV